METEIVHLPLQIIDDIVSRVDLLTIPCLKATCQLINNQVTTEDYNRLVVQKVKQQISGIIRVVQSYDEALKNADDNDKLFRLLLVKLHSEQKNKRSFASLVIYNLLYKVKEQTDYSIQRIKQTWMKHTNEQPLTEDELEIIQCLRESVLGTRSVYIVSFNYIDKYTKNKSFYCVINLQFHGDIQLGLSIQDVDPYREVFGTSMEEQTMEIEVVNETTLTELSQFMVDKIGTRLCLSEIEISNNIDKWIGNFTKYGEDIYDNVIHGLVNPSSYREEIENILC